MNPIRVLAVYALTLFSFLALDAVWLGAVAKGMYRRELGHLLAADVRWGAALVFYLLYIVGVLALVVLPGRDSSLLRVVALGALFGFVAYATYDLTNLATLREWPLLVTVVDLIWGAVLTAVTAAAGWAASRWLLT